MFLNLKKDKWSIDKTTKPDSLKLFKTKKIANLICISNKKNLY